MKMVRKTIELNRNTRIKHNLLRISVGMLAFIGILATFEQIINIQLIFDSVRYIGLAALIILIATSLYEGIEMVITRWLKNSK